jgi:uncharacterized membrane protein
MERAMDNKDWLAAEKEWWNSANWMPFGIYFAPNDPRVWVRKRAPAFGWTPNFAHRPGWLWMGLMLAVPAILIAVGAAHG